MVSKTKLEWGKQPVKNYITGPNGVAFVHILPPPPGSPKKYIDFPPFF